MKLDESLFEEAKDDSAWLEKEVETFLKKYTNNFTKKSGTVETGYKEEKDFARDILKASYDIVEVSDGRRSEGEPMSWVISYSDPVEP